ncbi:putative mitochondrial hypothetical protein [Leptomonas pyrrhocoris]|uniref:Metaxin glutathione S-transferase domain-containing protein n=1 Tax=Leptomonas pyrrhocoris TaxID=157538 RepID=A0A0M9FY69_LEPPY|nr:putative mitochondrial hypothetical protein [Leptomonas pyrrhocoris]KPA78357.1 putative mitochondrial hypothetical protein [Leptomonas pyrrhocoris]|eukprot:XP_015656796.1 putative mitochondrial hypothetical protein [Leptomonas pyrrhocoris]
MRPTTSSTVFSRYPAALSLPSADPSSLAVEVMLRFTGARISRRDVRLGDLSLSIHEPDIAEGSSTGPAKGDVKAEVCSGLMSCLNRLSNEDGVAQVSSTRAAEAMCAKVLTTQCIFPAFLFLVHFDPVVYRATMTKSVEPKVASFWEGLTGSYREHVLRCNPYLYTGRGVSSVPSGRLSVGHIAKLKEVREDVDAAFVALDALCAVHGSSADTFFTGTAKPTCVDALVYAAASSFFHADAGEAAVSVRAHQQRLMDACPHLLRYTERLRHLFFEADSGTYCLKPRTDTEESVNQAMAAEAEQQYRKGRLQTLWWTGLFATAYFILANADMVVALLEQTAEEAEEEKEEVAAEAAEGSRGTGAAPREPREL